MKWILKEKYTPEFAEKLPGHSPVVLQLLFDRGLDTKEKIDEFLNPEFSKNIHDPFLFKDMKKAVDRIFLAIQNQEKILIHGDYDADGVTASVLLEKTLRRLGAENLEVFIPHREMDGYGLSLKNTEQFIADGFNLIITVDCGITNVDSIKILNAAGVDTIITDHHLDVGELPPALAILDCSISSENYPFKKLSGVGMAFKLAQGLFQTAFRQGSPTSPKGGENFSAFEKWLLDLVTIGTIADMSPILGENRTLTKFGLMVLNKTARLGLRELIRVSNLTDGEELKNLPLGSILFDLNVRNISFQIAPRINAAGRIDHASLAYKLLSTEDEIEAIALSRDIHERNSARQKLGEQIMKEVKEMIGKVKDSQKIIIVAGVGWPVGLVGLVSGKLTDEFCRPSLVFAVDGEKYSGSGRSIPEFNITEALKECSEFLTRFGGHSGACGAGLVGQENYEKFVKKMSALAKKALSDVELVPAIEIDAEISWDKLDWELWNELQEFEPFAEANPMPLFLVKNLKVESVEEIGKNGGHLRFFLSNGKIGRKAVSFGTAAEWGSQIKNGDTIDAVMEFGINEWNGNRELQFKLIDFKLKTQSSKVKAVT